MVSPVFTIAAFSRASVAPLTISMDQGWELQLEGARPAQATHSASIASGTGVFLNARTEVRADTKLSKSLPDILLLMLLISRAFTAIASPLAAQLSTLPA